MQELRHRVEGGREMYGRIELPGLAKNRLDDSPAVELLSSGIDCLCATVEIRPMFAPQMFAGAAVSESPGSDQLLKWWHGQLDAMRFNLNRNLAAANILNADQRDALLSVFCDELVVAQRKFLEKAEQYGFSGDAQPVRDDIQTRNLFPAVELLAALGAGALAANAAGGVVVATTSATTGYLWWKTTALTTITLVSALATRFNVPATIVVTGIFLLVAYLGFKLVRGFTQGIQRRFVRRQILRSFDVDIRPKLVAWATTAAHP